MNTIIMGSRAITDYEQVKDVVNKCPFVDEISVVLSGGANGVDKLGELWAKENGVPVILFPADWNGPMKKRAGFLRNIQMAENADACIGIWDGRSVGTEHMMKLAKKKKLKLFVVNMSTMEVITD